MIFKIIKNKIPGKDFKLLMVESDCFMFTDKISGNEIGDGVLLLKMILDDFKPSTVINLQGLWN